MRLFDELTEDNFILFASKHYDNPQCMSIEEFYHDIQRFKYLKRLLNRYFQNGDLQERLILNHLVVLYNVFGIDAANKMIQFKITESEYWPSLKAFLLYLNFIREDEMIDIPLDVKVVQKLREL